MSDTRFDRLEVKLDKVIDKLSAIDSTLASQHVTLVEHIRRTVILEEAIKPLQKQSNRFQGVIKFFLYVATLGAGIEGFVILFRGLK